MCICNKCNQTKSCYSPCTCRVSKFVQGDEKVTTDTVFTVKDLSVCSIEFPEDSTLTEILDAIIAKLQCSVESIDDKFVKISANDKTAGYLEDKITAGQGIIFTKHSLLGVESIEVSVCISDEEGNAILTDPAGCLYVPTQSFVETPNTKTDTDALTVTLSGTHTRNIQVDLVIDPSSTAPISITEFGLKVDCCTTSCTSAPLLVSARCVINEGTATSEWVFSGACDPNSLYDINYRETGTPTFNTLSSNITCNDLPLTITSLDNDLDYDFEIVQTCGETVFTTNISTLNFDCDVVELCDSPLGINFEYTYDPEGAATLYINWANAGTPTSTWLVINGGAPIDVTGLTTYAVYPAVPGQQYTVDIYNMCDSVQSLPTTSTFLLPYPAITAPLNLTYTAEYNVGSGEYDITIDWIPNNPNGSSVLFVNGSFVGVMTPPYNFTGLPGEVINVYVYNTNGYGTSIPVYTTITLGYPPCPEPTNLLLGLEPVQPFGDTRELTIDWDPNNTSGQSILLVNGNTYGLISPPIVLDFPQNGQTLVVTVQNTCTGGFSGMLSDTVLIDEVTEPVCDTLAVSYEFDSSDLIVTITPGAGPTYVDYDIKVTSLNIAAGTPDIRTSQVSGTQNFAMDIPGDFDNYDYEIVVTSNCSDSTHKTVVTFIPAVI